ncbi:MAG TPA: S8 family serine peptidase, partial [Verrucomicrobiae bacterium]|nr:S8 family serine peptidase [Verrucomicrobiae bacterium]
VKLSGADPAAAVARLKRSSRIAYAGLDFTVAPMSVTPRSIPNLRGTNGNAPASAPAANVFASTLPTNFAVTSSLSSWLNAGGVNAAGAFDILSRRYGKLPGEGVIITNVSIGDLTDQSMADAGDSYVQFFGPTTVVVKGQRYLDVPTMPLIPTWSASLDGKLDAKGAVEHVDPFLGEVLLDFSVMAPLPHDRQRPGATGDGFTDLLGLAPGAQFRLVVPEQPTISNILSALVAASKQKPRPDVITASLGFGLDAEGFPGRYLEDDPVVRAAIRKIVNELGIVVCISANDGTRLFTPAAVGPDGGSAPTDLALPGETPTTIGQVGLSTAPSRIDDSGATDVGGSTLDDIFSGVRTAGGGIAANGAFPTTRLNGSTDFSSGFGTRVNVSAPADNIPSFLHDCGFFACTPQTVVTVLSGGTSASAPMTAAASAIAIQSARLAGRTLTPADVRDLLVRTGRSLPNPPQIGRPIQVGPQIDATAVVESVLGPDGFPSIVRLAVAHRQAVAFFGAVFVEGTDPSAIDLAGPPTFIGQSGQNVTGPITFAPDIVGLGAPAKLSFALRIGGTTFSQPSRVFRLLPAQILAAAGQSLVSTSTRTVPITYEIRSGGSVLASASMTLGFSATDGLYEQALAPIAPSVVAAGQSVTVQYDLTGVRFVSKPRLVLSSVNHWSPAAAPLFRVERSFPLSATKGSVSIPASAFTGGAGIYGVGLEQNSDDGSFGWFSSLRVAGASGDSRPPAPLVVTAAGSGYFAELTRTAPGFTLSWDASAVAGATGAVLEISAPGPTLYGSVNNFTNQSGDRRDANGGDSGSIIWYPLPGPSGSVSLDAVTLGLPSSLFYTARVFAVNRRGVTGLASPAAGVAFDDGITPNGDLINDFDIVPGGGSVVATAAFAPSGDLANSALRPYAPASGAYGPPFAIDARGQSIYYMFGSDPSLHRTSTISYDWFDFGERLETFDSLSGA